MADKRERRSHFRGKPRPGRRVEVTYRVGERPGDDEPAHQAHTSNIGVGGAFVVTDQPVPPGSRVRLSLRIPTSGRVIEIFAEVRWIADGEADAVRGMGVKFFGLDVDQLLELNDYFTSLTSTVDLE
jgi:uncharacterized protein (TIGR02266 family)